MNFQLLTPKKRMKNRRKYSSTFFSPTKETGFAVTKCLNSGVGSYTIDIHIGILAFSVKKC